MSEVSPWESISLIIPGRYDRTASRKNYSENSISVFLVIRLFFFLSFRMIMTM